MCGFSDVVVIDGVPTCPYCGWKGDAQWLGMLSKEEEQELMNRVRVLTPEQKRRKALYEHRPVVG